MKISIRTATSEDAIAIGELSKEFSNYLHSLGDTETEWISSEVYLRDGFGPNPAFSGLVAECEGKIMGYLLYHQGYDTDYLTRIIYIIDLYVQATWRRHGISCKLIEETADITEGLEGLSCSGRCTAGMKQPLLSIKALAPDLQKTLFLCG